MLKRIGGQWLDWRSAGYNMQVDGDKYICMDRISQDTRTCIIYSFGINDDWSFEDEMAGVGCSVHAYDHTIPGPDTRGERIQFHSLGLGMGDRLDTLHNILASNGHAGTTIEYLKVGE